MKKNSILALTFAVTTTFFSCTELKQLGDVVLQPVPGELPLTQSEVVAGLKEALTKGAEAATAKASLTDGFYRSPLLYIPFPEEAIKVKNTAESFGFGQQVEQFERTMNRAAEEASKEAVEVFIGAISSMTISDGFAILNGGKGAATNYLKSTTRSQLEQRFRPKVKTAIESVKLTSYWEPLVSTYNTFAPFGGGQQVNPDLEQYVTTRAIDGLFVHVEAEEDRIRENPQARVTELLKRVFGTARQ